MQTTETNLVITSTNDKRDKLLEHKVLPPLTLWGERILYICLLHTQKAVQEGEIKFKGKIKLDEVIKFFDLSDSAKRLLRKEIASDNGISEATINFYSETSSGAIYFKIFEHISVKKGYLNFQIGKEYFNKVVTNSVKRFSITTEKEAKNYTSATAFKMAKYIKDRTSIYLNSKELTKDQQERAETLRKTFENMSVEEIKNYLSEKTSLDFENITDKEKIIDILTNIKKTKFRIKFTTNEFKEILFGIDPKKWNYSDEKNWFAQQSSFINVVIKPALKQVNEYSLFNVSLPVFQEWEDESERNKIIHVLVTVKSGALTKEIESKALAIRQNLKIALVNKIEKNLEPILEDGLVLEYDETILDFVRELKTEELFENPYIANQIKERRKQRLISSSGNEQEKTKGNELMADAPIF